jgi:phosphoribosylformylglycinamidine synthase
VSLAIEVANKPGVTDPLALTARKAIETTLGTSLPPDAVVQSARLTLIELNGALAPGLQEKMSRALYNPLIQQAVIRRRSELESGKTLPSSYPHSIAVSPTAIECFNLAGLSDAQLMELSRRRLLALEAAEMKAVRGYFASDTTVDQRRDFGLDERATDVELEMIAQTWSEHCKHKIFNATIHYTEDGKTETIRSLFKTYIKATTDELTPDKPFLRSVFHDNSGVIEFDKEHLLCFKVETHNSPSALDPYGGAITGIVGVNRDILGTGKGAKPIFNTDVLCFGYPDTPDEALGEGLLHPRTVLHGVHQGIIDGGNQSGIPVVGGAFLFDDSFMGKPLVFCGTGGILPGEVGGEAAWIKHIDAGDLAVMVGGRIGKDGIHGATFSSQALDDESPTSAVQIGDPITQKRMSDFLLEARDLGLYKGITDNGAGGLSSSLGEMAADSGGIRIDLDACPLKYPGLAPWEILVSESQERMSLAVDPKKVDALLALAARRDVEASVVGEFTDSGLVEVRYKGQTVGLLSLEFLHDGLPVMELEAEWTGPSRRKTRKNDPVGNPSVGESSHAVLLRLLADPSIASKESLVRQYDHEVQARSVVKPFVGERSDGPSDGAVLRPVPSSNRGVTVTHGICPTLSDIDTYEMAMSAVDEAFRAHIALGGNPELASALDNFCWPDPVESERTPDGKYKLAQLVRACRGLKEACLAYGLPLISGKDSMKNDAAIGGVKVSIRPTLLVSLMGIIDDLRLAITSDFKKSGHIIYLVGHTGGELGGSSYERLADRELGPAPRVRPRDAARLYAAFHRAASGGIVSACHDLSDGGLAVALCEAAFAGRLGAEISLDGLPPLDPAPADVPAGARIGDGERLLFCESPSRLLATVAPEKAQELKACFAPGELHRLGVVTDTPHVTVSYREALLLETEIEEIGTYWRGIEW